MSKRDPFPPAFDGLPLLSDPQIGGMGLFFLRVSYLLFSAIPLVLSMLDAIAGTAANLLYLIGALSLAIPLFLDVVRRISVRDTQLDSLLILVASLFLIWNRFYTEGVVFLITYHSADLIFCLVLRHARSKCAPHITRVLRPDAVRLVGSSGQDRIGDLVRAEAGEVLGADCRIQSGEAICSLSYLDADGGEFWAKPGDIIFAGTLIVEGGFSGVILSLSSQSTARTAKRKLVRCLSSVSPTCRRLSTITIPLQTLYLLIVLLNATFFEIPLATGLLAFCAFFFCFGCFSRFVRAKELYLLGALLKKGIYPENIREVERLHITLSQARFLEPAQYEAAESSCESGRRFHVLGRLPRQRIWILENASESSRLIARCDFALMYRDRNALAVASAKSFETAVLYWLILLFGLISGMICVLLFALSASLTVACLLLLFSIAVCAFSFSHSFAKPFAGIKKRPVKGIG